MRLFTVFMMVVSTILISPQYDANAESQHNFKYLSVEIDTKNVEQYEFSGYLLTRIFEDKDFEDRYGCIPIFYINKESAMADKHIMFLLNMERIDCGDIYDSSIPLIALNMSDSMKKYSENKIILFARNLTTGKKLTSNSLIVKNGSLISDDSTEVDVDGDKIRIDLWKDILTEEDMKYKIDGNNSE